MAGGVAYDETMEGWFALGATTPEEGVELGKRNGTRLSMQARVTVDDLGPFLNNLEHPCGLVAGVDFPPLGLGIQGNGVFKLLSPGPDGSRRMVYDFTFQANAKTYFFSGEKRVQHQSGFDLWPETTTLYSLLYEGSDKTGRVAGAGILRLSVQHFLHLLTTLKPINGGDRKTVATFGRFFFGELWELYAPHVR